MAPPFWWWGRGTLTSITLRWNLIGALFVALAVLIHWHRAPRHGRRETWFFFLLLIYVANAFFVHWQFADNPEESWEQFDLVWKSCLLAILLRSSIWTSRDLDIVLMTILLLSTYVGYEVVINEAGKMIKGRLEGINFPGASGSNGSSTILSLCFPFIAYFVVTNPFPYSRLIAFCAAPLVLDTLLRCNSRGAYLGAAIGGILLIAMARGNSRKYAVYMMLGGLLAFYLQAKDEKIWNRLFSIGAKGEERDNSALERIEYWKAAREMIKDYPLGSGGRAAFVSARGVGYISHIRKEYRSVHNGYYSIAAGWGVQGLAALLGAMGLAMFSLFKAVRGTDPVAYEGRIFLGAAILAAFAGQAVCTMFGDYLDGEWFLWLTVFGLSFAQIAENDEALELEHQNALEQLNERELS